jgi:hypothetical protein
MKQDVNKRKGQKGVINDTAHCHIVTLSHYLISLLAVIFLSGCITEEFSHEPVTDAEEGDGMVTVTLNIPAPYTMRTYAPSNNSSMDAKNECDIVEVDMLIFGPDNEFLYREKGSGISDGGAGNERTFSVKIRKTADPTTVTAFIYANVRDEIDAALEGPDKWITTASTKAEIIDKLVFDLPVDETAENQGGKWLVLPGRYTRFPMWGESTTINLTAPTIVVPSVTMLRAVARMDVGLAFPTAGSQAEQDVAAGLTNFFLEEVRLYNASDRLRVAPTATMNGTAVTGTSIPPGTEVFDDPGDPDNPYNPILYERRSYTGDDGYKSLMREIYLAEHAAGSDLGRPSNLCIVVGGHYGSITGPMTYYRIDMMKTTVTDGVVTAQEYLPILRNHRYKVNITAVHALGYDSPREAFDAMGLNTNLTVVITSDDERVTEIVYDGQYMLGVGSTAVNIDKRALANKKIFIKTDYPKGWKATVNSEAEGWLTLDADGDEGRSGDSWLSFTAAEYIDGTSPRTGTITIQAGRLYIDIEIIQSHTADFEILDTATAYLMEGKRLTIRIKSNYAWKVRVEEDLYNIVTDFDLSGNANTTSAGEPFGFTLIDNYALNKLLEDNEATFVFYSETDEFAPKSLTIQGTSSPNMFRNIGGVDIYATDQTYNNTNNWDWYTYANVRDEEAIPSSYVVVPGDIYQVSPPREGSCAALNNIRASNPWRLPTRNELSAISTAIGSDYTDYNFTAFVCWAANTVNSNSASVVRVSKLEVESRTMTDTGVRARCVKTM